MTHWQYPFNIIFSCILCTLIISCSTSSNTVEDSISSITLSNGTEQTYTIYVQDNEIGTNIISVTTGVYKSFNDIYYQSVLFEENIELNSITKTIQTFIKNLDNGNGYYILSDETGITNQAFIPFPINSSSEMIGRFGIIDEDLISVTLSDFHTTYTNKNGHVFNNVAELTSSNDLIKVFINETYFIIQKEDYRYNKTIESLNI